jgi:hypothetical protein
VDRVILGLFVLNRAIVLIKHVWHRVYTHFSHPAPQAPILLAFHGEVGAGKDTAASFLPYTHRFGFADPLKQMAAIGFGFTHEQLYDPVQKEVMDPRWGASPRAILQWLGTDVLRARWEDFFTRNMDARIEQARKEKGPHAFIVLTDCRFPNEAEFVHHKGGFVVKIVRGGGKRTVHHGHASEQGLPDHLVDEVVHNPSDTLAAFKTNVVDLVGRLEKATGSSEKTDG